MVSSGLRERIRTVRDREGLTQEAFAEKLGVTPATVNRYENGHRRPDAEFLDRMVSLFHCDPAWLLTGRQDVGGVAEAPAQYGVANRGLQGYVSIPLYGVEVAAGVGAVVGSERIEGMVAFRYDWIRRELGVDPGVLVVITVKGESMEPTLRAGDLIVVDRSEAPPAHEGLYVVRIGDALLVKRVQFLPDRTMVLTSDHPAYKPVTLKIEEAGSVSIVGRVAWVGRRV